jgi:hypothetical protein
MSKMTDFYDAVFQVLRDDAAVSALVPEANIRPSEDPVASPSGNMVFYGWTGGRWDKKRHRGEGTLALTVAVADNKVEAGALLDLVRIALTPKELSSKVTSIRIALFSENDAVTDGATTDAGRYQAATSFAVKMVEAA